MAERLRKLRGQLEHGLFYLSEADLDTALAMVAAPDANADTIREWIVEHDVGPNGDYYGRRP